MSSISYKSIYSTEQLIQHQSIKAIISIVHFIILYIRTQLSTKKLNTIF